MKPALIVKGNFMKRILFLAACAALLPLCAQAKDMTKAGLSAALNEGGNIIYFRHFETGADTADQHKATLGQCATQRQLNAKGARQAIAVRDAFANANIPVVTIYASPFCRAWQSADLAFGRHEIRDGLKLPPSKDYTDADKAAMKAALLPLLTTAVPAGKNIVIMGHDDNLPATGGPEIKMQGEAVVMRPDGKGGFTVMGHVKPYQWTGLLNKRP
jgi:phosphohistidine phosphatase SixA